MATLSRLTSHPSLRAVAVSLAVAGVGLGVGTGLVLVVLLGIRFLGVAVTPLSFIVVSLLLVQGVTFGGVGLGYLRYRGLGRAYLGVRFPSVRDLVAVVVGYVLALGAAFAGAILISLTGAPAGQNQVAELATRDPTVLLLLVPGSFLLIGPGEELLFRGVVQNRIRESFPPVSGIALASAIFASVHFLALTGGAGARLVTVTLLFFPSVVFGSAYELTDNLLVPAVIHGAYNATLFSLFYLALRFADAGSASALL